MIQSCGVGSGLGIPSLIQFATMFDFAEIALEKGKNAHHFLDLRLQLWIQQTRRLFRWGSRSECEVFKIQIELHFEEVKPDRMFLSVTDVSLFIPVQEFTISVYSPLIIRQNSWNHYGHGFGSQINIKFHVAETPPKIYTDFPVHLFSCDLRP